MKTSTNKTQLVSSERIPIADMKKIKSLDEILVACFKIREVNDLEAFIFFNAHLANIICEMIKETTSPDDYEKSVEAFCCNFTIKLQATLLKHLNEYRNENSKKKKDRKL